MKKISMKEFHEYLKMNGFIDNKSKAMSTKEYKKEYTYEDVIVSCMEDDKGESIIIYLKRRNTLHIYSYLRPYGYSPRHGSISTCIKKLQEVDYYCNCRYGD